MRSFDCESERLFCGFLALLRFSEREVMVSGSIVGGSRVEKRWFWHYGNDCGRQRWEVSGVGDEESAALVGLMSVMVAKVMVVVEIAVVVVVVVKSSGGGGEVLAGHSEPERARIQTEVLGHSLVHSLVRLHSSLLWLLRTNRFARALHNAHSLARSLTSLTPELVVQ